MSERVLVPVLGDQLSHELASLRGRDRSNTVVLMMEVWEEATYVKHHKQKIALIFSAMRHFAGELRAAGWQVDYTALDDPDNAGTFTGEVARAVERHAPDRIVVVEPGEWRVRGAMDAWAGMFPAEVTILPDDRFVTSLAEFREWADGREHLTMEFFYREVRQRTGILMDAAGKPKGGAWNFDKENRRPPARGLSAPPRPLFGPDAITRDCIRLVEERFGDHFGSLESFGWPVTRAQALEAADAFFAERLALFGPYEDAMLHGADQLFHSMLSTSLNLGLLEPRELCRRAERMFDEGTAPINSVEGFVRQIIGWREYVRGFYWYCMPQLAEANALDARLPLPEFFWTGETDMRCVADCVRTTRDDAHAHHIQRLMVLGNFCLLAGVGPREVQDWYLVVYADAYEWVELPNVSAMILYADGGRLATKPYAASGNYINTMSDYCGRCRYDVRQKTGPDACPFNPLYWHFMDRHRARLERNRRIGRIYATWDRMSEDRRRETIDTADAFLKSLTPAQRGWSRPHPEAHEERAATDPQSA
ncbi:cryptochrome/photolyase family protein [Erythrobacteraceae bacterium CFH 75059]|uniref:cryptochrome/photolyase family protein n=1 Tax=Qipengyuania thermophila TaxID=2509361 RepID=UPI00102233D4|nr:cryptochrome/photolyase family protein [Qipengyuania thermophila]TCD04865.1 cryptochrome/photolyase family protein [Erythrobacteraceae bacterium CFH 75059]